MASVLVVDDEVNGRDALCAYLVKFGHSVVGAASGDDALIFLFRKPPDVIVLDLSMPKMDGPSLLEIVRAYLRFQSIPVIVWTGIRHGSVLDRVQEMGVHSILFKPNDSLPDVRAAVERAAQCFQPPPSRDGSTDAHETH